MKINGKVVRKMMNKYGNKLERMPQAKKAEYLRRWNNLSEEQKAKYRNYLHKLG